jgi:hypothetical protein
VFPEGGLTRDGALRPPKLGLLSYMVSGFDPHGGRDIVFVPVGLNYDRVLEDRILTAAASTPKGERPRFAFNPVVLGGFLVRGLWLRLRRRWYRYGYACVSFGNPMSLRAYLAERGVDLRALPAEQRFAEIERLGTRLMHEVGRVVPALPVSLVATVILHGGERGLSSLEIKGAVFELMETLKGEGAHVHIPRQDQEYAVEVGLRMLLMRHPCAARGRRLPPQHPRRKRCCAIMPTPSPTCWMPRRRQRRGCLRRASPMRSGFDGRPCQARQPRKIGADQILDQAAGRLVGYDRQLVRRRQGGDAVHAGPQHPRGALSLSHPWPGWKCDPSASSTRCIRPSSFCWYQAAARCWSACDAQTAGSTGAGFPA